MTKNFLHAWALASLSVCLFAGSAAGSVLVHVVQNDPNSNNAGIVPSAALPSADFTSPDIDFETNSSDGTTLAAFLNNPTFTNQQNGFNPNLAADDIFLEITAETYLDAGNNSFVVGHDDGVVLVFADPSIGTVVNAPGPTGFVDTPFNVVAPSAGLYSFDLKYTECCDGPADLVFNINGVPVGAPEPANLGLSLLGLAGIFSCSLTMRYRQRRRALPWEVERADPREPFTARCRDTRQPRAVSQTVLCDPLTMRFSKHCPFPARMLKTERMDETPITVRKYTDFAEMKADEYRYWQSRPAHERLDAVEEMIETAYALKGWKIEPDVPRLQRPFVRLPVPWR